MIDKMVFELFSCLVTPITHSGNTHTKNAITRSKGIKPLTMRDGASCVSV